MKNLLSNLTNNKFVKKFKTLSRKKIALIILIIIFVVGGIYYFNFQKKDNSIKTAVVKRGDLNEELVLTGSVDALEKATLSFAIPGKINYMGVKKGDNIKQRQLIASLDQSSTLKSLQSAMADYNKQRNSFEQTKDDQGFDSPNDAGSDEIKRILQNNQYDLDKAVISVELKEIAQRDSYLYSPIGGVVASVSNVYPGSIVNTTTVIAVVINPDTVYFSVEADQTEVVKLNESDSCSITLDAYPDQTLKCQIKSISYIPKEGESGTVYQVDAQIIGNQDVNYRIGMTGDATFITDRVSDSLYLPISFVKSDEKGSYVYINPKKEKKYVKTGIETDESIQVKSGLSENEVVYD